MVVFFILASVVAAGIGTVGGIPSGTTTENGQIVAIATPADKTTNSIATSNSRHLAILLKHQPPHWLLRQYPIQPPDKQSVRPAESGGSPHFPNYIKGEVNNNPRTPIMLVDVPNSVPTDPVPAGANNNGCIIADTFFKCYTAEYIWNVASLGLSSGNHSAEFVIHDGDSNRGVGCINIKIQ